MKTRPIPTRNATQVFRSHSQNNKARLALKIHQRIEEDTFKNLCRTF